jgi:hypothetical protein
MSSRPLYGLLLVFSLGSLSTNALLRSFSSVSTLGPITYERIVAFVRFGKGLSCFATNGDDVLSVSLVGKRLPSRSVDETALVVSLGLYHLQMDALLRLSSLTVVLSPSFHTMWVLSVRIGRASATHVPLSGSE